MSLLDIQIESERNYIDCNNFEDMNNLLAKGDHIDTRCGEIFISRCKVLIFLCCECKLNFASYEEFFNHLCEEHVSIEDEIKQEPKAEDYLDVEYYDEESLIVVENENEDDKDTKRKSLESKSNSINNTANRDILAEDDISKSYEMAYEEEELSTDFVQHYYEDIQEYDAGTELEEKNTTDAFLNEFPKLLDKNYQDADSISLQEDSSEKYEENVQPKNENDIYENDSSTEDSHFKCNKCNHKFDSHLKLKNHKKTHAKERRFKCHICGFAFTEQFNLRNHLKRHDGTRPHSCNQCEKKFITKTELNAHIRTHTGERPYICEICGSGFVTSGSLNEHKKRHTNYRPHKCMICYKTFYDTGLLKEHMVVHSGERSHICDICRSSFTRRKALLQHLKLHSEVKQYKCLYCAKAFAQKPGLASHLKTHRKAVNSKDGEMYEIA